MHSPTCVYKSVVCGEAKGLSICASSEYLIFSSCVFDTVLYCVTIVGGNVFRTSLNGNLLTSYYIWTDLYLLGLKHHNPIFL